MKQILFSAFQSLIILMQLMLLLAMSGCGGGSDKSPSSPDILHSLSGVPNPLIYENDNYHFQITLINLDQDPLAFKIENRPSWLTISQTGLLAGTPLTEEDAGIFPNIVVSATDNKGNVVELPEFQIEVIAVNDDPIVSFNTSHVLLDEANSFSIAYTVSDEEGDEVSVLLDTPQNFLTATTDGFSIDGFANATNVAQQGTLTLILLSNEEQSFASVDFTITPLTASGFGKTLIGRENGPGVHLVILGDGYRESEQTQYQLDVLDFIAELAKDPGVSQHLPAWNLHIINTPSVNSGADDVFGEDVVNTFYNAGFNCADIARLICFNSSIAFSILLDEFPEYHQAILVVNDTRYGGSGGAIATYSSAAKEVALHELGHSFAGLADEYVDAALADNAAAGYFAGQYANISNSSDPNLAPWSIWIEDKNTFPLVEGESGIGLFEGALYNAIGFYRPQSDSRMRSNFADFGSVNTEQWLMASYAITGALLSRSPVSNTVTANENEALSFSLELLYDLTLQKIEWFLNDIPLPEFTNQSSLQTAFTSGEHSLKVVVSDISGKIRKSGSQYSFVWSLTIN